MTKHPKALNHQSGKVLLVGAGPGDPELLTLKALRAIQQCDLILYDRLVSAEIRELFPDHTPAQYVGKASGQHSVPQEQLNRLMVEQAKRGLSICRLKGGDPFVFGRGSEEMLALRAAGIEVELVPGITAASGCSSYAGIPLTHRGLSQSCTFVTGHGAQSLDLDWAALASMKQTLVFYMGLTNAQTIASRLMSNGLGADTPVALVERGSTPRQRVVTGSLRELPRLIKWYQVSAPALIVIGEVVSLAAQLQWFSPIASSQPEQLSA